MSEQPAGATGQNEALALSPEQSRRKQRLELWAALFVGAALVGLTLLQRELINLGPGLSRSQGLVALVSINISVVLMVFLLLLILRGLFNVFFEKRAYGTLQTKLVVAFITLSLLPTLLIFHYSYRQLIRGHSLWFSPRIESALRDSIDLTEVALAQDNPLPAPVQAQIEEVRRALVSYQDALSVQRPFRVTQLTALTVAALLAVFISVWIGSHLARTLARPVTALVGGTQRVAAGDWDFQLEPQGRSGEFAELVNSFNRMTGDLKKLYAELDSRRRFVETVLKSVSTGVVILDPSGRVISLNRAAAGILAPEGAPGEPAALVLPAPLAALVDQAVREPHPPAVEQHMSLSLGDDFASLRVKLAPLVGEGGETLGLLLTFDDLTELEKAQRLAAWREVARRIAHEVKNPLTPIQLSAGRLKRRFSQRLSGEEDSAIFEECTTVIIRQVEEMKKLVDEFSHFARLPEIKPRPADFVRMLDESLALFRQAHKKVDFRLETRGEPPVFAFDPDQMGRVMTNILNNAVTAMNGEGQVIVLLETDDISGLRLTVSDTGPGLDPTVRDRLFDPQVTTKSGGQGLGPAGGRALGSGRGGFIRAQNRREGGARFILELPLRP
ncbi:MAG: HAMP domain-containing protein [Candidatus Adiutrix sp.]|nr:HAMP domain-containing protein [Candidatus Adiutrix sp.]